MEIRYVDRDRDGNITGTFAREQYKGQEALPEDGIEVEAFTVKVAEEEEIDRKINDEMVVLTRATAIQNLKNKGDLPPDYTDISR